MLGHVSEHDRPSPKRPGGRKKGGTSTREAILRAAMELFAEGGYERTTLRAITDRAGVDVAMVSHFFGSKQGLFTEAVLDRGERATGSVVSLSSVDWSAAQLLDAYFAVWEEPETALTVRAVFRAALESEERRELLQSLISRRLAEAIRHLARTGPDDAAEPVEEAALRTQSIAAHLMGIGISRYIMRLPPLADAPRNELIAMLTPVIEAYLPSARPNLPTKATDPGA